MINHTLYNQNETQKIASRFGLLIAELRLEASYKGKKS
jgi:hypothetical protein